VAKAIEYLTNGIQAAAYGGTRCLSSGVLTNPVDEGISRQSLDQDCARPCGCGVGAAVGYRVVGSRRPVARSQSESYRPRASVLLHILARRYLSGHWGVSGMAQAQVARFAPNISLESDAPQT
jgi:hypothetical protein